MDIILFYNFNSLIWLTGIVEVVSTCSRQPKLIPCSKNDNNNYNVPFLHVLNWKSNKKKKKKMLYQCGQTISFEMIFLQSNRMTAQIVVLAKWWAGIFNAAPTLAECWLNEQ